MGVGKQSPAWEIPHCLSMAVGEGVVHILNICGLLHEYSPVLSRMLRKGWLARHTCLRNYTYLQQRGERNRCHGLQRGNGGKSH